MFLSFIGISFLFHLVVILSASLFNKISNRAHLSAYQTYGKHGGWFTSQLANRITSYAIMIVVGVYIISTLAFTIYLGILLGADEPQVMFAKSLLFTFWSQLLVFAGTSYLAPTAIGLVVAIALYVAYKKYCISVLRNITSTAAAAVAFVGIFRLVVLTALGTTLFAIPALANAQIVEPGFESEVIASGFSLPTATAFADDGRIFVAEKNGVVKVVKNGEVLATPVITLTDINTFGDRGLIGMAIDPDFANNGYMYLSYTFENTPGLNPAAPKTGRIVRVEVVDDVASESSKVVLVGSITGDATAPSCDDYAVTADCIASDSSSHSVGALTFGPDGMLYASTGDGADFAAIDARAFRSQDLDSLAGKVLRINADGTAPTDNPFFDGDVNSNRSKVYAYGFRNQFRLRFNEVTGRLYGGDVGWSDWEEVNDIQVGGNYGWPCREGANDSPYACANTTPDIDPLYDYAHNSAGAGSIVIGAFGLNDAYPDVYDTSLFIGDYAQQWIKRLILNPDGSLNSVVDFQNGNFDLFPVEFNTGTDGNVYYIDVAFGTLNRLTHTDGNRRPVVSISSDVVSGLAPLTVQFSSVGTFDPDGDALSYDWSFGDGQVSTLENPSHTYTADGVYNSVVTVTDSFGAATARSVDVTVGNQAPVAIIESPASGSLYDAGAPVTATASGFDAEDGDLPDSAFNWTVLLHHNTHVHTLQQFSGTKEITFTADDHNALDVYVEVILTVTDSNNLTDTTSVSMYLNNGVGGGNLVSNPGLEVVDPNAPQEPLDWIPAWFGAMNPTFTYPVAGLSGDSAAQVTVANYDRGAARWFFAPVQVTPGETYRFSNIYTSDVTTSLTVEYTNLDGSNVYNFVDLLQPTNEATPNTYDIVVPEGVQFMSVFHDLFSNGTLTVDEYSLTLVEEQDTNPPTGSITNIVDGQLLSGVVDIEIDASDAEGDVTMVHLYVNGERYGDLEDVTVPFSLAWDTTELPNGTYQIRGHLHDEVDNHGLTPELTVIINNGSTGTTSTGSNLVQNSDFELDAGDGSPFGWTAGGWGTHTRELTYPVAGYNSDNAIRVEITEYELSDTGDSKWRHDNIPVVPGTEYLFDTYYRSNTISDVIAQYTLADGSFVYQGIGKEIQPSTDWALAEGSFIAPTDAVSMSAFHLISAVGYLEIDDVRIVASSTGNTSETNPPYIAWESHATGDVVNGVVTFVASSSDDTEVVGVYYGVNGTFTAEEDFDAPYTLTLDTTEYADGDYILKATSHDVFGNNDVDEIVITIDNTNVTEPPVSDDNLVYNGDFELVDAENMPLGWREGGYGANDTIYDVVATPAGNVGYVEIFNYTNGDAKWVFDDVDVIAGETYEFSADYSSKNSNEVVAFYQLDNGETRAELLDYSPAYDTDSATDLTNYSIEFVIPDDATAVTVFHTPLVIDINEPSYGYIDNVSLVLVSEEPEPPVEPGDNLIQNADFADRQGTEVDHWNEGGWGTNTANTTYAATAGPNGEAVLVTAVNFHESGDAKWYFDDVLVTAGEEYFYTGEYQADIPTSLTARYTLDDDTVAYEYLTGLPASAAWATISEVTIVPPVDAVSLTIFHVVAEDGVLYTYAPKLTTEAEVVEPEPEPDITGPGIVFSNLSDGETVSEIVTINLDVQDESEIELVGLLFDGGIVGIETNAPYSFTLDTTTYADGSYVVVVEAVDVLSNDSSESITIVVDNSSDPVDPPVTGDNLISNGDLNTGGDTPDNWFQGGWGDNDRIFTYPVAGSDGDAARVEITDYTSGDAKWYFAPLAVVAGETYTYSHYYQSDVVTEVIAQYTLDDGTFQYEYLVGLSAAAVWTTNTGTFTAPTDAVAVTIFHNLATVGVLTIDGWVIQGEEGEEPDDTQAPTVGFADVFDGDELSGITTVSAVASDNIAVNFIRLRIDGGTVGFLNSNDEIEFDTTTYPDGTFVLLLEAEDDAGNLGVSDEITITINNGSDPVDPPVTGDNLISNGDLNTGGDTPDNWFQGGWGDNDRIFTYPVAGSDGDAARVEITDYTSGDAKWYFADVDVAGSQSYTLSIEHNNDITGSTLVRYTLTDGSFSYVSLGQLATAVDWTVTEYTFDTPAEAESLTIFPAIAAVGYLEIDNLSLVQN